MFNVSFLPSYFIAMVFIVVLITFFLPFYFVASRFFLVSRSSHPPNNICQIQTNNYKTRNLGVQYNLHFPSCFLLCLFLCFKGDIDEIDTPISQWEVCRPTWNLEWKLSPIYPTTIVDQDEMNSIHYCLLMHQVAHPTRLKESCNCLAHFFSFSFCFFFLKFHQLLLLMPFYLEFSNIHLM